MKTAREKSFSPDDARGALSPEQLARLEKNLLARGVFSPARVRSELNWFCRELGIGEYYFRHTPLSEIARHLESLSASRIISENSSGEPADIHVFSEKGASAFYMVRDDPDEVRRAKQRIESHYQAFRLESYRSRGYPLRLLNVSTPSFPRGKGSGFAAAAGVEFSRRSPLETVERYRRLWEEFQKRRVPLVRFSDRQDTGETRVMAAVESPAPGGFFTASDFVFRRLGMAVRREYVEPFADGTVIYSIYTDRIEDPARRARLGGELSAALGPVEGRLAELFYSGALTAAETAWAAAAGAFAHQFLTTHTEEYTALSRALQGQPEMLGLLSVFKTHLAKDTYHEERILDVLRKHPGILKTLYGAFRARFDPDLKSRSWKAKQEKASTLIAQEVSSEISRHILEILIVFNDSIRKTNFFRTDRNCLCFRLDPGFLNPVDYPARTWGIFFLLGRGFRGFHVRFRDIARGGIRFVRSPSVSDYDLNSDFIFDENYNLAMTQQRKNKDIPEGGAKGTILPGCGMEGRREEFFRHYIDGLLDVILPHPRVVDYLGREEILFLGPDEGTADLMDWAARHARERGYRYWRAFTTGKSPELGGIPHDEHGMTTHGVRQFVEDVIAARAQRLEDLTKFQTGGPDGDLGSNEILLAREKTVAVIDGSGVLYDPRGLDRKELIRLARARATVSGFRRGRLSRDGYFVGVADREVVLPDGTKVANGTEFRNLFHFHPGLKADLFVPCGGRPRAININNWEMFLEDGKTPRAPVIVEGANLFITQEARLRLEEAGVTLIKDASANKGGVTSSSLEVLASLVMSDREYERLMVAAPGRRPPAFRDRYIREIISHIRRNAHREFLVLWAGHQASGTALSILSDRLSDKINTVTDLVRESALSDRRELVGKVLGEHCPPVLLKKYPPQRMMKTLPDNYLKAFFAAALASDYVYAKGLEAGELDFFEFVEKYARA